MLPSTAAANVFGPNAVDPEVEALYQRLVAEEAALPQFDEIGPVASRASRHEQWVAGGSPTSKLASERTISGPAGPIPLRILTPEAVRGVYLQFHGGGMVLGDAIYSDLSNEAIALQCQLAVVSVNYRRAPEDRYPAAPDDCEAAALWLAANARAELGSDRLLIGGESAGANLAAVTLIRLRDRHQLQPFTAANLVFGVYDFAGTPSVTLNGQRTPVLNARRMNWFADLYVGDAGRLREPDISPLWSDLAGLPPALFTVGTMDPLLDDSLFMHGRWLAAGNESEVAVYPGGTHLFTTQQTALARQANARIQQFLAGAAEG